MRLQHWRLARIASCSLLCGFGTFASPRSVERLDSHRSTSAFTQSGGHPRTNQDWEICKSCLYRRSLLTDCVSSSISKDKLDAHQENIDKMRYDLRRAKPGAREGWRKLGGVQQETPAYSTDIVMGTKFPWDVTEEHLNARQDILDQIRKELGR